MARKETLDRKAEEKRKEEISELVKASSTFMRHGMPDKAFSCMENLWGLSHRDAYPCITAFRKTLGGRIGAESRTEQEKELMADLLKRSYLLTAIDVFDDFCIYIEYDKPIVSRFYLPRRRQLYPLAMAMQDLEDDRLDLLTLSLPPGVGKTTLAIYYLAWVGCRHPDNSILGGSHSGSILKGIYKELQRVIDPKGEYLTHNVFPDIRIVSTNGEDMRIDLNSAKRFETYEFSSVGSGNAGKVRCSRLLYLDDLIDGIETAMSHARLDKLWEQYTTDYRQRKIGMCKELHIATRWSVHDVIGRLETINCDNPRARFISIPAMDDNDESNFDFPYVDAKFTTRFYRDQRETMDQVSWKALYMNQPIEREGLLFEDNEMRRFFSLPEGTPDGVWSVCDTKSTGADYCVMPIAYQYGSDYYIEEIICDDGKPETIEVRLADALLRHKVRISRFESNSSGEATARNVDKMVREKGGVTRITTKYTTANKETRIVASSPFVKGRMLFKDESLYTKEYKRAMDMLFSYTMKGKNKHDDVPDALSMLSDFLENNVGNTITIVKRQF